MRVSQVACKFVGMSLLAVRPEGANYQWRKIPPRELSIDLEADERLDWVTGWAGASDKGRLGRLSDPAGRNACEARAGLESDNADADPPAIWGRLHERGSIDTRTRPIRRGSGARHVGKVVRVIRGDPSWARVAASTSRQAAALAGVGQGHAIVEAGQCRWRKGPYLWCAFEDGEVVVIVRGSSLTTPSKTGAVRDCCIAGRRRVTHGAQAACG